MAKYDTLLPGNLAEQQQHMRVVIARCWRFLGASKRAPAVECRQLDAGTLRCSNPRPQLPASHKAHAKL